jgi:hypothetical protein
VAELEAPTAVFSGKVSRIDVHNAELIGSADPA